MARRTLPDAEHVPIGLTVSETDAAQIDEVLTRPEFDGWSRSEWCREIIRTALRYYVGGPPPGTSEARAPARPAAAQQASPGEQRVPRRERPAPGPSGEQPAPMPAGERPAPMPADDGGAAPDAWSEPEDPARPECPHPADARDYERGVCAACGTVIWD
ncbi:MAG TPA: hypothetical protein VEC76_13490 [Streptosporangiaceae bacterium]|nr:hypothetical protein [Streptosporangiaceae bacterium]